MSDVIRMIRCLILSSCFLFVTASPASAVNVKWFFISKVGITTDKNTDKDIVCRSFVTLWTDYHNCQMVGYNPNAGLGCRAMYRITPESGISYSSFAYYYKKLPAPKVDVKKRLGPCSSPCKDEPSTKTHNPIDFAIGNKFFSETDYRNDGLFPLAFRRTYNSLDIGWKYSYMQNIEILSADKVAVHRHDGRVYEYLLQDGLWVADPDVVASLEGNATAGWVYHLIDNTTEQYDATGRLLVVQSKTGLQQTISYDDAANRFVVTDPVGNWLEVTLNEVGSFPLRIQDNEGRIIDYQYSSIQQLLQVDYFDGISRKYLYENSEKPWLLTGIIDESGVRSNSVGYDASGLAVMSELANGVDRVDVTYNDDGSVLLNNALDKQTLYHFETYHGVRKITQIEKQPSALSAGTTATFTYDTNGFLSSKTDENGIITTYTRDAMGREISRTEAFDTPEARTITTEWHPTLYLRTRVTEPERETTYQYDSNGLLLSTTVRSLP